MLLLPPPPARVNLLVGRSRRLFDAALAVHIVCIRGIIYLLQVYEAARQVEHLRSGLCRTALGLVGVLRVERYHMTKVEPETFRIIR